MEPGRSSRPPGDTEAKTNGDSGKDFTGMASKPINIRWIKTGFVSNNENICILL